MTTGTTKTKERLDRIVLHKNGFLSFLELNYIEPFFSHRSDHIPIILRTVEQRELAHGSSKKK